MATYTSPLDGVRVAAPCSAEWERMTGDAQTRFCDQCNLNVYNLSGMTKREAEALIANREGRLCVRFYRRADGTILTDNCPVGLRALKRRVSRTANALFSAVVGFLSGFGINLMFGGGNISHPLKPHQVMGDMVAIEAPPVAQPIKESQPDFEMGEMAVPPAITPRAQEEGWVKGRTTYEGKKPSRGLVKK